MIQLIQPENIVDIVFSRKIQNLHFKPAEIQAVQYLYCYKILGTDFMEYVEANQANFETFITEYINPVLAFAAVVHHFYRIYAEITDRGINAFNNQGSQQIDENSRQRLLMEYDVSLQTKVEMMVRYAEDQADLNDSDYSLLNVNSDYESYFGSKPVGKAYKATHI